eukprot:CAMPEP_0119383296 /NCGR_PEP_ID=MMETSP1334-20130426/78372_1 /TAXON_ID=127549 /ORGANISM="Calcidiscus leptoporus, Strain RCC1130" /LENGTH=57 /DNA_ID=CAMNT_0007404057 /DNA_START=1 /DNA_END=170 /DNA_ORIENTATION=-
MDRALELSLFREVIDRRAQWLQSQPWDWAAALLLGAVHKWPQYRLLRLEPLGRDRHG